MALTCDTADNFVGLSRLFTGIIVAALAVQRPSSCESSPNEKQNDRADNRQDETGRMKRRTLRRFGKQAAD